MTPIEFLRDILTPGIAWCEAVPSWHVPFDDRARLLMLAIAGQESGWSERIQGGPTPAAHGFWQFERLGGVRGVLMHPATMDLAHKVCVAANVLPVATNAWGIMATPAGDNLSVAFPRLLLFTDPHALPDVGDEDAGWDYYVRNWRPGAVAAGGDRAAAARERWGDVYAESIDAMKVEKQA